jgi:hypothetical protein
LEEKMVISIPTFVQGYALPQRFAAAQPVVAVPVREALPRLPYPRESERLFRGFAYALLFEVGIGLLVFGLWKLI